MLSDQPKSQKSRSSNDPDHDLGMRVRVGMIFRRLTLVPIPVVSVIRSFNLPAILVVLDHRFFQFPSRWVVPLLCHTPCSRSRLKRFLSGKYLAWKRSFIYKNFPTPVAAVSATSFAPTNFRQSKHQKSILNPNPPELSFAPAKAQDHYDLARKTTHIST